MDLGLKDKVAIVGGASKGLGKACALVLAQEGAKVAICSRSKPDLESAAEEIASAGGGEVMTFAGDLDHHQTINELISATVTRFGRLDIMVNNSGGPPLARAATASEEQWETALQRSLMFFARMCRESVPHLKEQGGGRIINIGGMAARNAGNLTNSNGVTNSAVSNIAKNLGDQVAHLGILVNCIHPGTTRTPRQVQLLERRARDANITVEEAERRAVSEIPIGRMVEPEEIANLVLFLVSEKAAAITGQTIAVEGGAGRGVSY